MTTTVQSTDCTRGLYDWRIASDYRVTGNEPPLPDEPELRAPQLVYGVTSSTRDRDTPPRGWLHRQPTEAEEQLARPASYPLDHWADPNVQGTEWPLAVAPYDRPAYLEADQHIAPPAGRGTQIDMAAHAHWPALSRALCSALPGAFTELATDLTARDPYYSFAPTTALLDHYARLQWIREAEHATENTPITKTCTTCQGTFRVLPGDSARTPRCHPCTEAHQWLTHNRPLRHILRHLDKFTDC